jgi:ribosomal protein S18 acetylase RimI-like enzyme
MLALLPQLADFKLPPKRHAKDLWESDAQLLEQVIHGHANESFADVITGADDKPLGMVLITLRSELMSKAPSAHLEAIVVQPQARGRGLGRQLLAHAETAAAARGAQSLSLHVFSNNLRARGLYDEAGYDSELIRAIKWFY